MRDYRQTVVTRKLTQLLDTASFRRACSSFESRFAAENPMERVCNIIEALR
jgi:hypothetical protein